MSDHQIMKAFTRRSTLVGIGAIGLLLGGCVAGPTRVVHEQETVVVYRSPPPLREEAIPPAPSEHVAWERGHWNWNGHDWEWVPGNYETMPYEHAVWVPGHWDQRNGGWVWVAGYWHQA